MSYGGVALYPLAAIPEAGPSGTSSFSNNSRRNGGITSNGSSSRNDNGNGHAQPSFGETTRAKAHQARKKAERFMHEKAPGVSSIVAGHPHLHNNFPVINSAAIPSSSGSGGGSANGLGNSGGKPLSRLTSSLSSSDIPIASSSASTGTHQLGQTNGGGNAARLAITKKRPGAIGSRRSRYSQSELAHLVPDPEGADVLHDPEYEAIKMVSPPIGSSGGSNGERRPGSASSSSRKHRGTNNGSSSTALQYGSALDDGEDDDESSSEQSIASSTEDEQENGMEAFSPTSRRSFEASGFGRTSHHQNQLRQPLPSRSYTYRPPSTPITSTIPSYNSASHPSPFSPSFSAANGRSAAAERADMSSSQRTATTALDFAYSKTAPRHSHPVTGMSTANLDPPNASYMKPASIQTKSSDRSRSTTSRRTYADGPATYIAPSITMRPLDVPYGQARNESYNPYTYVPTTLNASEAYSHSRFTNTRPRPNVNFGPSTTYVYDDLHEEVAPPIAWQSSFTPSAEHSERHRTSQHESNVSANLKRSIQSVKLDISFGLLRLGKKK